MAIKTVAEEQVLMQLRRLDADRWFEVLDFIGYLKLLDSEPVQQDKRGMTARDLLQSDIVGLWNDREDIGDSLTFARQLRYQAEHRQKASDDDIDSTPFTRTFYAT